MKRNWKIIARDTFGKETLIRFCHDISEGKEMLDFLKEEQRRNGLEGELVLTAVLPEWISDPKPSDYKNYVRSLIPDDEWMMATNIDDPTAWYNLELGNMEEYYLLAKVIPRSFTVIDFGSGKNAQSYLFRNHRRHIAVDTHRQMFRAPGTSCYQMTTANFIRYVMPQLNLNVQETFAICSNATGKDGTNPGMLVRMNFLNMYTINNSKIVLADESLK